MYHSIIHCKTLFTIFMLSNICCHNKGTFCYASVESTHYVAGVVEYHPNFNLHQGPEIMNHNLENYLAFMEMAKNQSVEILVFPEATFNRHWAGNAEFNKKMAFEIPEESEKIVVCDDADNYHKMLVGISCAAKEHRMYVVINVVERSSCADNDKCPSFGYFLFNTNVVFDRNGAIISKYRKINLFVEPGFQPSVDKKLGVFETDFGVKFGHFICFDILFQTPAVQILKEENVQNIIFSTMWFSELPFLVASEIQQGYAFTHNINLLASGANNPIVGCTGSGIYSGHEGALVSVMRGQATSDLLVANVPKIPVHPLSNERKQIKMSPSDSAETLDGLSLKHYNLIKCESHLFNDLLEDQTVNLTNGRVNCVFNLKIDSNSVSSVENKNYYRYRAVVFDGIRSYITSINAGIADCAVVACTNESLTSCGTRFPKYSPEHQRIHIMSLKILATVPKPRFDKKVHADSIVYHPVSMNTKLLPLAVDSFEYIIHDMQEYQLLNMTLTKPQSELLTFGVLGLIFDKKTWLQG